MIQVLVVMMCVSILTIIVVRKLENQLTPTRRCSIIDHSVAATSSRFQDASGICMYHVIRQDLLFLC